MSELLIALAVGAVVLIPAFVFLALAKKRYDDGKAREPQHEGKE